MPGELNDRQIQALLTRQITGRIGCHYRGTTYIVPINYVYKDGIIYAHSAPGKKIMMMRSNPNVCLEVEEMESIFRWQTVIAWGKFVEITDEDEKQRAKQGLIHRLMPLASQPVNHPWHGITADEGQIDVTIHPIIYKIVISKATGRYELD